MGTPLKLVENNLHQVSVQGKAYLFHIPSTSLFERDALTGDIFTALRMDSELNQQGLVQALCDRYPQRDIESALEEFTASSNDTNMLLLDRPLSPTRVRPHLSLWMKLNPPTTAAMPTRLPT